MAIRYGVHMDGCIYMVSGFWERGVDPPYCNDVGILTCIYGLKNSFKH